jgi:hypothetical protein
MALWRSSAEPCIKINWLALPSTAEEEGAERGDAEGDDDLWLERKSRALRSIPADGSTQTTSLKRSRR